MKITIDFLFLYMCQDQNNSLIIIGQAPFKIRWVGRDTMCYHLIKRPFISGQVISTTDSKILLWLLQTTLAPMWCLVSVWLPRLVLGALWASASPLRLLPTLLPPLPPVNTIPLPGLLPCSDWLAAPTHAGASAAHSASVSWTQPNPLRSRRNLMATDYTWVLCTQKHWSQPEIGMPHKNPFVHSVYVYCVPPRAGLNS